MPLTKLARRYHYQKTPSKNEELPPALGSSSITVRRRRLKKKSPKRSLDSLESTVVHNFAISDCQGWQRLESTHLDHYLDHPVSSFWTEDLSCIHDENKNTEEFFHSALEEQEKIIFDETRSRRSRQSVLGRHPVILLTSEDEDEDEDLVKKWVATSPFQSPAKILDEDPNADYIVIEDFITDDEEDNKVSECTSKRLFEDSDEEKEALEQRSVGLQVTMLDETDAAKVENTLSDIVGLDAKRNVFGNLLYISESEDERLSSSRILSRRDHVSDSEEEREDNLIQKVRERPKTNRQNRQKLLVLSSVPDSDSGSERSVEAVEETLESSRKHGSESDEEDNLIQKAREVRQNLLVLSSSSSSEPDSGSEQSVVAVEEMLESSRRHVSTSPLASDNADDSVEILDSPIKVSTVQGLETSSVLDESVPLPDVSRKHVATSPVLNLESLSDDTTDDDDEEENTDRGIPPLTAGKSEENNDNLTFLTSLSLEEPSEGCHPDAIKYLKNYAKHKHELAQRLYNKYNVAAFDSALPHDLQLLWNPRLTKTAGVCVQRRIRINNGLNEERLSRIELSTKVLDTADRLRDTLIHEMCHAAAWIVSGVRDGHGKFWQGWAATAMKAFPELPIIGKCHTYAIRTKFTYVCDKCGYRIGRHSKSLDVAKKCCGYCRGKFVLLSNKTRMTSTTTTPNKFAMFVKQNYKDCRTPGTTHAQAMKALSKRFAETKIL